MAKAKTSRKKTSSQMVSDQALTKARYAIGEDDSRARHVQLAGAPRWQARIVDQLGASTGATADELAEATGWQKHSVLGALSRLRSRGFAVWLNEVHGRKAYRIEQPEG
jgi:hypothetical protein